MLNINFLLYTGALPRAMPRHYYLQLPILVQFRLEDDKAPCQRDDAEKNQGTYVLYYQKDEGHAVLFFFIVGSSRLYALTLFLFRFSYLSQIVSKAGTFDAINEFVEADQIPVEYGGTLRYGDGEDSCRWHCPEEVRLREHVYAVNERFKAERAARGEPEPVWMEPTYR